MAAWLIPALKAVLPHVGTIISVAAPVFTKKSSDTAAQASVLQQQITELQAAAAQNAVHIKELAEQLQATVVALEQAGAIAGRRLRRLFVFCLGLAALSAVTLGFALYLILTR